MRKQPFAGVQIIPFIIGMLSSYPIILVLTIFFEDNQRLPFTMMIAGAWFTGLSFFLGRAWGWFYRPIYREVSPTSYWFWTGEYVGFIFGGIILLITEGNV